MPTSPLIIQDPSKIPLPTISRNLFDVKEIAPHILE